MHRSLLRAYERPTVGLLRCSGSRRASHLAAAAIPQEIWDLVAADAQASLKEDVNEAQSSGTVVDPLAPRSRFDWRLRLPQVRAQAKAASKSRSKPGYPYRGPRRVQPDQNDLHLGEPSLEEIEVYRNQYVSVFHL